jgi:hypothetical protein
MIPSTTSEYWIGFSNKISASWVVPPIDESYIVTYFQLHRDASYGTLPLLSLRMQFGNIRLHICGNSEYMSKEAICTYYNVGKIVPDKWDDWVIHSKLSHSDLSGVVEVWRNNQLLVSVKDMLTSFNDPDVPYVALGIVQHDWQVGRNTWFDKVSVSYKSLKLGTATSN